MRLLVIRHAIAAERDEWAQTGKPDGERPLTDRGRSRMREAARGLARLVDVPDVIATSPLTRAAQTAAIVGKALGAPDPAELPALLPDADYATLVSWLRGLKTQGTVAVVGHEPHLSGLVCYLLTGRRETFLDLKKGAAALIQLADPPTPGVARLLWTIAPGGLRRIE